MVQDHNSNQNLACTAVFHIARKSQMMQASGCQMHNPLANAKTQKMEFQMRGKGTLTDRGYTATAGC